MQSTSPATALHHYQGLNSEGPPRYVRKPARSAVDAFEARIREQLRVVPMMPAAARESVEGRELAR